MNAKLLTVAPSPHVHQEQTVKKIMYGVIIAMLPALLVSVYVFGISALYVSAVAVASCIVFEYAIQKYLLKETPDVSDGSAIITGLLLAFNVPSNLPWYIIVIGSLVAIGIGKMSFGGLGGNPFNPALVGRVFLLISFPVQMTSWPLATNAFFEIDGVTGATLLGAVKEGLKNGESVQTLMENAPTYTQMLLGYQGGSLGEISTIAILLGFGWMLYKKIITWHTTVSMLVSVALFSGIFWLVNPDMYLNPMVHLLTGGVMLGAVFMATDYVTSPVTHKGQILFGVGIGLITVLIRCFGSYPEGVSFAILIMNAFVPMIDKYVKPHRFGATSLKSSRK
ncbi:MAG: Na+-transporting NADH:ubiquinone oxidoreductase subunit D [Thalassobius sp.]|nr:Na+-transporting NADH:ubiquinone oxidoreductase subunit D [Thalassovita sp.]